jgi:hypothetical protein
MEGRGLEPLTDFLACPDCFRGSVRPRRMYPPILYFQTILLAGLEPTVDTFVACCLIHLATEAQNSHYPHFHRAFAGTRTPNLQFTKLLQLPIVLQRPKQFIHYPQAESGGLEPQTLPRSYCFQDSRYRLITSPSKHPTIQTKAQHRDLNPEPASYEPAALPIAPYWCRYLLFTSKI